MPSQIHAAETAQTCDSLLDAIPLPQAREAGPSECIIFLLFHQMRDLVTWRETKPEQPLIFGSWPPIHSLHCSKLTGYQPLTGHPEARLR